VLSLKLVEGFCLGHREQDKYTLTDLALILIISALVHGKGNSKGSFLNLCCAK
jgi:hypothetical protein